MIVKTSSKTLEFVYQDEIETGMTLGLDLVAGDGEVLAKAGEEVDEDLTDILEERKISQIVIQESTERWIYTTENNVDSEDIITKLDQKLSIPKSVRDIFKNQNILRLSQYLGNLLDFLNTTNFDSFTQQIRKLVERTTCLIESATGLKQNDKFNSASDTVSDLVEEILIGNDIRSKQLNELSAALQKELIQILHIRQAILNKLIEIARSYPTEMDYLSHPDTREEDRKNEINHTNQYFQSLLDSIPEPLESSILTDQEQKWTQQILRSPSFDQNDSNMKYITARSMQIVTNLLFRGIYLQSRVKDLVEYIEDNLLSDTNFIQRLTYPTNLEFYLTSHFVNVLVLNLFVANKLNLSDRQKIDLSIASLFHDLGMLRTDPAFWAHNKTTSDETVQTIQKHPLMTVELLERSPFSFSDKVKKIIRHHHERLNGSGYPGHVTSDKINKVSRVMMVSDVYSAMSTTRPHRSAIPCDKIISYLKNHTEKFDTEIVTVFEQEIGPYPPGTVVKLNTNEIGISVKHKSDPYAPDVKILLDQNGEAYEDPKIFDISDESNLNIIRSVGSRSTPQALQAVI